MELTDPPAVETPARARGSADYERVARAIAYLLRHAAAQPDLAAVARHVHLSEFHYESPFGPALIASTARGICALRFLEHATERAAAARLREGWPEARLELDRTRASELGKRIHSLPSRDPGIGSARRLPLGRGPQSSDARLGSSARHCTGAVNAKQ